MKRSLIASLSVLFLSTLTATAAKADNRVEAQLRLTHPTQVTASSAVQAVKTNGKTALNEAGDTVQNTNTQIATKLSERDRLILQYQTQTVIPAEAR